MGTPSSLRHVAAWHVATRGHKLCFADLCTASRQLSEACQWSGGTQGACAHCPSCQAYAILPSSCSGNTMTTPCFPVQLLAAVAFSDRGAGGCCAAPCCRGLACSGGAPQTDPGGPVVRWGSGTQHSCSLVQLGELPQPAGSTAWQALGSTRSSMPPARRFVTHVRELSHSELLKPIKCFTAC